MAVELGSQTERIRFSPISWPAVFASLAVGISVMLLMTLAGVAVGISSADAGDSPRAITIAAATWQAVSMLVAAAVGGYVAARLSGLRRTGDGVLHGAVAWGATTVLYAVLATTALGALTSGMFGLLTATERTAPSAAASFTGDRDEAQRVLERIGLTTDQARTVVDELARGGSAGNQYGSSGPRVEEAADAVGTATAWLAATVLLSLLLSAAGGALGARGVRRTNHRANARNASMTTVSEAPAAILSRQV